MTKTNNGNMHIYQPIRKEAKNKYPRIKQDGKES